MNLLLCFDYEEVCIRIPDRYVRDVHALQEGFFDWLYDRAKNWIDTPCGGIGLTYGSSDFLDYLNESLLADCNEQAYVLPEGTAIDARLRF